MTVSVVDVIDLTAGGRIVTYVLESEKPGLLAVSVTFLGAEGVLAVPVNSTDVLPLVITTEAGTLRNPVGVVARLTVMPTAGAGLSRVTRPVPLVVAARDTVPKTTAIVLGVASAFTVRVADLVAPERLALRVTSLSALTTAVEIEKLADVVPLGTVTLVGTVTDASGDDRVTVVGFETLASSPTVPVTTVDEPPMTEVGKTVKLLSAAGAGLTARVADLLVEL
jgi:hypothetical protein